MTSSSSDRALTPRQLEVAQLVASRLSAKAIAQRIGIAPGTVHAYIRDAAERIGGPGRPRERLIFFVLELAENDDDYDEAAA